VIEAVLFDFGGVILTSPFDAFAAYEAEAGLPPDTIRRINATDPDTNAWARFERREVGPDEFCSLFEADAAELGFTVDATRILDALHGDLRPAMVEALRLCSARFRTALLTNNTVPMAEQDGDELEFRRHGGGADCCNADSSTIGGAGPWLDIDPEENVLGISQDNKALAIPLSLLRDTRIYSTQLGGTGITLLSTRDNATRAYATGDVNITAWENANHVVAQNGELWRITEHALLNDAGVTLPRIATRQARWAAWKGAFEDSQVAQP
jgi:hypothetical protein